MKRPHQTAASLSEQVSSLQRGFLEPQQSRCNDIVDALRRAIHSKTEPLPQKYLYCSLNGSKLWSEMCSGRTHIFEVYRQFPFAQPNHGATKIFKRFGSMMLEPSSGTIHKEAGVIVLGAGTGTREAIISNLLMDHFHLNSLRVVLVDLSSALLAESLLNFRGCRRGVVTQFAVLDFDNPQDVAALRRESVGNLPCLFVFLGNTLCNIEERAFLAEVHSTMKPGDLLLCEVLLADDAETRDAGKHEYRPTEDSRAQFVVDPIRAIGLDPKIEKLQRASQPVPGERVSRTYRYVFDAYEAAAAARLSLAESLGISNGSWIDLLKIDALTSKFCKKLFGNFFGRVQVVQHPYPVGNSSIQMGYCFAADPKTAVARAPASALSKAPTHNPSKRHENSFCKKGDKWEIQHKGGDSTYYDDTFGAQYVAILLKTPGQDFHCSALAERKSHATPTSALSPQNTPILDAKAKQKIRQRIEELEEAITFAASSGSAADATELKDEKNRLEKALATSSGMAGRNRSLGDTGDNVRNAVCNRIRAFIKKLRENSATSELGRHFAEQIHLGFSCRYPQDHAKGLTWHVET
jgi:uncharacterized SAM-dependent methyltransferase